MQTASPRTAPLALWRVAEAFLHTLYNLFGGPEDVARDHTLTHKAYTLLLSWLRVGEALLRRLIAIEAAAFPKPDTQPRLTKPRQRVRKLMHFTPDNPEAWRVSLRCFVAHPALRQAQGSHLFSGANTGSGLSLSKARPTRAPKRFHDAWPLAERYEALLRVFNESHAYARRLARRLHARPHLIAAVLHEPEHYVHRVDDAEAITAAVRQKWRNPDSS
jgi:hypothetical protein